MALKKKKRKEKDKDRVVIPERPLASIVYFSTDYLEPQEKGKGGVKVIRSTPPADDPRLRKEE